MSTVLVFFQVDYVSDYDGIHRENLLLDVNCTEQDRNILFGWHGRNFLPGDVDRKAAEEFFYEERRTYGNLGKLRWPEANGFFGPLGYDGLVFVGIEFHGRATR